MEPTARKEYAYYYPDPMWRDGDWIKNLILFFDGVALLVPNYLKDKPLRTDPAIVAGLQQHNLLHIIEPEQAVDKAATEKLAAALQEIIDSGSLDKLRKEDRTAFDSLSRSRLGFYGDEIIAEAILAKLKERGLAGESEDGSSIPMHRHVRSLVLVLLSQILRPYGETLGADLSPATDVPQLVHALTELLGAAPPASTGAVIEFDISTVSVDLGSIPIDEILDFRKQNLAAHRLYCSSARVFADELSRMNEAEREHAFDKRQAELQAMAADLSTKSRKAWKKPASFSFGLVGAAASLIAGHPLGAALSVAGSALGYQSAAAKPTGAYSYLFQAQRRFGY